ncbi:MAG: acyl carrier protein [bacterium]|nr:acyl carrier protein [bacterium]
MSGAPAPDRDEIRRWLLVKLGQQLPGGAEIEEDRPLADYGLKSVVAIGVTGDLEDWLDLDLDPTVFFDHPTLGQLADLLAAEVVRAHGGASP